MDEIIQVHRGDPDPEELAALTAVLLGLAAEAARADAADIADVTTLPTWRRRDPASHPAPRSWAA